MREHTDVQGLKEDLLFRVSSSSEFNRHFMVGTGVYIFIGQFLRVFKEGCENKRGNDSR